MDQLLALAEAEGIIIEHFPFERPLMGLYVNQPGERPIIGLSTRIELNSELRCILAEELGHHFTSTGHCIAQEFYHYAARVTISKIEYKALKWAALFLMPPDKLLSAIAQGHKEIWELADYFDVTEEMVKFRLRQNDIQKSCFFFDIVNS